MGLAATTTTTMMRMMMMRRRWRRMGLAATRQGCTQLHSASICLTDISDCVSFENALYAKRVVFVLRD
eukprot:6944567-Pyramimonas_sp.AAC.1